MILANAATPTSRARPSWAKGASIYLKIGGHPTCVKSGTAKVAWVSATPYTGEFQPEDLGKTAYWIITRTDGKTESSPSEPYGATMTE